MAKVHERILEILVTADEGDDSLVVTGVRYYRNRGQLDDSNPKVLAATPGAAGANTEVEMGEVPPPPTHIRLVSTFQA